MCQACDRRRQAVKAAARRLWGESDYRSSVGRWAAAGLIAGTLGVVVFGRGGGDG